MIKWTVVTSKSKITQKKNPEEKVLHQKNHRRMNITTDLLRQTLAYQLTIISSTLVVNLIRDPQANTMLWTQILPLTIMRVNLAERKGASCPERSQLRGIIIACHMKRDLAGYLLLRLAGSPKIVQNPLAV